MSQQFFLARLTSPSEPPRLELLVKPEQLSARPRCTVLGAPWVTPWNKDRKRQRDQTYRRYERCRRVFHPRCLSRFSWGAWFEGFSSLVRCGEVVCRLAEVELPPRRPALLPPEPSPRRGRGPFSARQGRCRSKFFGVSRTATAQQYAIDDCGGGSRLG